MPWVIWGLGAAFYCYGFFQRVAPSVMLPELMREFAVGAAITGMLSALYFYSYAGLQIPIGLMIDRWGPRRLLAVAAILAAVGSALFAMAPNLGPAYVGRVLIGAGASVTWVATLNLIAAWFPQRRFAMLTGLTLATGMAGAVGGQAPLSAAVQYFGWRGTMWGAAVAAVVLAVAIWWLVRDRRPDAEPRPAAAVSGQGIWAGLRVVLGNPQTAVISLHGAMMAAPMLAFGGLWGVPYMMQAHAVGRPAAALATSMMLVGCGIGAPLGGWLSDRIKRRRLPMLVNATGALATISAALYLPGVPLPAVYVLLFLNGLFAGGMVISFAAGRERNPGWAAGATLGVVNMAVMSTGAIFQPLIGWLLDRNWAGVMQDGSRVYSSDAFAAALLTLPACTVVALLAAALVRETHCRPQA